MAISNRYPHLAHFLVGDFQSTPLSSFLRTTFFLLLIWTNLLRSMKYCRHTSLHGLRGMETNDAYETFVRAGYAGTPSHLNFEFVLLLSGCLWDWSLCGNAARIPRNCVLGKQCRYIRVLLNHIGNNWLKNDLNLIQNKKKQSVNQSLFQIPLENGEKEWQTIPLSALFAVLLVLGLVVSIIIACLGLILKENRAVMLA